jgi:hypothetical protein
MYKEILIGRKSNQTDPGYVYVPYIPANISTGAYGGINMFGRSKYFKSIPETRTEKIEKILSYYENGF